MSRREAASTGASGSSADRSAATDGSRRRAAPTRLEAMAPLFARLALAGGFLSAVADRLGLWGPPGADGVAWGSVGRFLAYTETLNPWFPASWIPAVGAAVTVAEASLAVGLLAGWRTRFLGAASGFLLLAFGIGMTAGTGVKSALDASVFAAAAAGFLLMRTGGGRLSVDGILAS